MIAKKTPKLLLLLAFVALALVLVGCGGDAATETPAEPTTSDTDVVATEEPVDAQASTEEAETPTEEAEVSTEEASTEEAEAPEEVGGATNTSTTVTGLTSEEEVSVKAGYPCTATIVGEAGALLRGVILQRAKIGSASIRAARAGDIVTISEHTINTEGVWYELQGSSGFLGFVQEAAVQLSEDCPLYGEATEG